MQIAVGGSKQWLFRYMRGRKARHMGLGPVHTVTLSEARELATAGRRILLSGDDPIERRRGDRMQARVAAASVMTFRECADAYISAHRDGWKNLKHQAQWPATLTAYVFPVVGDIAVEAVDVGLVMKILEPIWKLKPETAGRVRGRIELILDWAAARGYRRGDNPARWRGHLDKLLPAKTKVHRVRHHPALPYAEIPAFMGSLRDLTGVSARALEFTILTAARTGEVIGARWSEITLESADFWTISAERMKGGRDHRVPLSERVVEILRGMPREGDFVFIGGNAGAPLSNMALLMTLRRMERSDLTVHGFRSTFRDWAAEQTAYPQELCEMALAHAVSDKVEAAYRRGDMLDKRRRLMTDWAVFCALPISARERVVAIRASVRPD